MTRLVLYTVFVFTVIYGTITVWPLHQQRDRHRQRHDMRQEPAVVLPSFNVTFVTAFYDIQRADRGFEHYKSWIQKTLRIPHPFVVFCRATHESVVREARSGYMHMTTIIVAEAFPLEGLAPIVEPIAQRVGEGRDSPEWTNAKYIPITFSKFSWLDHAIELDSYHTTHFYWVDAGISRFFEEGQPEVKQLELLKELPDSGIAIQAGHQFNREYMEQLRRSDIVIGSQINYFVAGVFGGRKASMRLMSYAMIAVLTQYMLAQGVVDNEQIGFAVLYTLHKDWFRVLVRQDFTSPHCQAVCL